MVTRTTLTEGANETGPPGGDGPHALVIAPEMFFSVVLPESGQVLIGRSTNSEILLDDPLASRRHAMLHVGPQFAVQDLGSANGTRLNDTDLPSNQMVSANHGDPIVIGSTVVIVQSGPWWPGPRRLWTHGQFEERAADACKEASQTGHGFALMRLQADRAVPWTRLFPILARCLRPPNLFGVYGRNEYEALLLSPDADLVTELLKSSLQAAGINPRLSVARFPRDGRTTDALLGHANTLLRSPAAGSSPVVAWTSDVMRRAQELAERAARSTINVLILGETGVGKEVMARLIHQLSGRAEKPLVSLNCAGLTESLIESELFGHEKGAFTGATHARVGLLESAQGGTVFLDEIGEMPPRIQATVLRAIETREIMPVGGRRARTIDVRFIAATNRDLETQIEQGSFRQDLFFRLNGITVNIPPLRERRAEIPQLADSLLTSACRESAHEQLTISPAALTLLEAYRWPGNVRELKNVIERAIVLCEGAEILPSHLPLEKMNAGVRLLEEPRTAFGGGGGVTPVHAPANVGDPRAAERQRIMDALQECAGNQSRAAKLLGISRRTLVSKLDLYDVPRPQKPPHGEPKRPGDDEAPT